MENETASCQNNSKPFNKQNQTINGTFSLEEFLEKKIKRKNSMWSLQSDDFNKEPDNISQQNCQFGKMNDENVLQSVESSNSNFTVHSRVLEQEQQQKEIIDFKSLPRKHSKITTTSNVSEDVNNLMQHMVISWYYFFSLIWKIIKSLAVKVKLKLSCFLNSLFNLFFIFVSKVLKDKNNQAQFLCQSPRMTIFDQFLIFIYQENFNQNFVEELNNLAQELQQKLKQKICVYIFTREKKQKIQTPFLCIQQLKNAQKIYQEHKKNSNTFVLLDSKVILKDFQNIKIFNHSEKCQNIPNKIKRETLALFFTCQLIFHQFQIAMQNKNSSQENNESKSNVNTTLTNQEFLPISNISKIMKSVLDDKLKISKEAKSLVEECVTEFICFITSEASEKCKLEKRKTINSEDILTVMNHLGFENYVIILKVYLHKYKQALENLDQKVEQNLKKIQENQVNFSK